MMCQDVAKAAAPVLALVEADMTMTAFLSDEDLANLTVIQPGPSERKRVISALWSIGLITDEQVDRAYQADPELRAA